MITKRIITCEDPAMKDCACCGNYDFCQVIDLDLNGDVCNHCIELLMTAEKALRYAGLKPPKGK